MSGGNLVKFHLGALDRVRDRALGVLGSGTRNFKTDDNTQCLRFVYGLS